MNKGNIVEFMAYTSLISDIKDIFNISGTMSITLFLILIAMLNMGSIKRALDKTRTSVKKALAGTRTLIKKIYNTKIHISIAIDIK